MGGCASKREIEDPQNRKLDFSLIGLNKNDILLEYDIKPSSLIGEGSYGKVYKSTHLKSGCIRAIKLIHRSKLEAHGIKTKELFNEIEILRKLSHPNIMEVYEYFEDQYRIYICTEYIEGNELFDYIVKRKHFNEENAKIILKQILEAMNYCHSKNIVHRDLKPENIMITSSSQIKIIDFGTSTRSKSSSKILTDFVGTTHYIAPEVILGKYTKKCDIWSSGVIFYILLTGVPPFKGSNENQIYDKIKKLDYIIEGLEEFKMVSKEAKELLKKMMCFEKNRLSADESLHQDYFKEVELKKEEEEAEKDEKFWEERVERMRRYSDNCKLIKGIYNFSRSYVQANKEKEELSKIFKKLDTTKDGLLDQEEFGNGFQSYYKISDINEIFKKIDMNQDGKIDFNEFVNSNLNYERILTKDRLDMVFRNFDRDNNNLISIDELRSIFKGMEIDNEEWKKLIQEIDENGDSQISYSEFQKMVNRILG